MSTGHKNRPQLKDIPEAVVLRAQRDWHARERTLPRPEGNIGMEPWDRVAKECGVPVKLVYLKMEKMEDKGLLDSGVSTRTGWPTEKGLELLARSGL